MELNPFDDDTRRAWKSYPIRTIGARSSRCCGEPTFLVQSMPGGFVTQNCSRCNTPVSFTQDEFAQLDLWIACPWCRGRMDPVIISRNYGYYCQKCGVGIELATLVPDWQNVAIEGT